MTMPSSGEALHSAMFFSHPFPSRAPSSLKGVGTGANTPRIFSPKVSISSLWVVITAPRGTGLSMRFFFYDVNLRLVMPQRRSV